MARTTKENDFAMLISYQWKMSKQCGPSFGKKIYKSGMDQYWQKKGDPTPLQMFSKTQCCFQFCRPHLKKGINKTDSVYLTNRVKSLKVKEKLQKRNIYSLGNI